MSHARPIPETFPPGYAEEYIGHITRNVTIAFTVLEIVAVGLRYLALNLSQKRFGIDDILILPGLIVCLGLNASTLLGIKLGRIGYHYDVVAKYHPEALIPWAKILVVTPILYSAACAIPRVVLLTLYLRIFEKRPYRIACYVLIGVVVALAVADILVGGFECIPIAYLWDKSIPGGYCIDIPMFYRYGTLPNPIIDVFILILPQPVIWKLHTSIQARIGIALTFLTGSIGLVTSVLRCLAFFQNDPLEDGTYISVTFLNWSVIEPGVYLIAACLPCYRPLLRICITGRPNSSTKHPGDSYLQMSGKSMDNTRSDSRSYDDIESTFAMRSHSPRSAPWRQENDNQHLSNPQHGF